MLDKKFNRERDKCYVEDMDSGDISSMTNNWPISNTETVKRFNIKRTPIIILIKKV